MYDTSAHTLQRVSSVPSGIANGDSIRPNISPDGRFVTFASTASNLVPGDNNGQPDTFVKDLQTGVIERVSTAVDGTQANGDSSLGSSVNGGGTGTYIAFGSAASNLAPGDANGAADIFVLDRSGGTAGQVVEDLQRFCVRRSIDPWFFFVLRPGSDRCAYRERDGGCCIHIGRRVGEPRCSGRARHLYPYHLGKHGRCRSFRSDVVDFHRGQCRVGKSEQR